MEGAVDVKKLVNDIFARKGAPKVDNFAKEFADGSKYSINHISFLVRFQELFNILFDERIDCKLVKSNLLDERVLNWNRINGIISIFNMNLASICFNYLQQQFYLVKPSMKALAKGNNEEVVLKLLKNLINSTQGNYHETFLDDDGIKDIADVLKTEQPLYAEGEDPSILESHSQSSSKKEGGRRSDKFAYLESQLQGNK